MWTAPCRLFAHQARPTLGAGSLIARLSHHMSDPLPTSGANTCSTGTRGLRTAHSSRPSTGSTSAATSAASASSNTHGSHLLDITLSTKHHITHSNRAPMPPQPPPGPSAPSAVSPSALATASRRACIPTHGRPIAPHGGRARKSLIGTTPRRSDLATVAPVPAVQKPIQRPGHDLSSHESQRCSDGRLARRSPGCYGRRRDLDRIDFAACHGGREAFFRRFTHAEDCQLGTDVDARLTLNAPALINRGYAILQPHGARVTGIHTQTAPGAPGRIHIHHCSHPPPARLRATLRRPSRQPPDHRLHASQLWRLAPSTSSYSSLSVSSSRRLVTCSSC